MPAYIPCCVVLIPNNSQKNHYAINRSQSNQQLTQGPPPPGEDPQPNQEFPESDIGFLLRCFNEIGYNTQIVGSDQLSYVLMRNKLIGGVLFLQYRRKPMRCGSLYGSFAYDCLSTVLSHFHEMLHLFI